MLVGHQFEGQSEEQLNLNIWTSLPVMDSFVQPSHTATSVLTHSQPYVENTMCLGLGPNMVFYTKLKYTHVWHFTPVKFLYFKSSLPAVCMTEAPLDVTWNHVAHQTPSD